MHPVVLIIIPLADVPHGHRKLARSQIEIRWRDRGLGGIDEDRTVNHCLALGKIGVVRVKHLAVEKDVKIIRPRIKPEDFLRTDIQIFTRIQFRRVRGGGVRVDDRRL